MSGTATGTTGAEQATATSQFTPGGTSNPDVTRLDDTTASDVSDDPIDVASYLGTPTWVQLAASFGKGYSYPIPSQTTSFRTGDSANIESTVFGASVRDANKLKIINSLSSFLVLNNNNSWGNTNRLTAEDGTQTFTANLVLDNYTGLMYFRTVQSLATWNDAIDNALASTEGGFSDWFVTNLNQITSLINFESTAPLTSPPINVNVQLWLSDTDDSNTLNAMQILSGYNNMIDRAAKTATKEYIFCRKHF